MLPLQYANIVFSSNSYVCPRPINICINSAWKPYLLPSAEEHKQLNQTLKETLWLFSLRDLNFRNRCTMSDFLWPPSNQADHDSTIERVKGNFACLLVNSAFMPHPHSDYASWLSFSCSWFWGTKGKFRVNLGMERMDFWYFNASLVF